jgi:hypothetical protein
VTETCPGCGLVLAPVSTPAHPYIGASPSCWALYGEQLAREYERWDPEEHRLSVDAYAVQHPGGDDRRARQSVAYHLTALHLTLERGLGNDDVVALLRRVTAATSEFPRLEPPRPNGAITVRDVLDGTPIRAWAADVWSAWSDHHDAARSWAS